MYNLEPVTVIKKKTLLSPPIEETFEKIDIGSSKIVRNMKTAKNIELKICNNHKNTNGR